MPVVLSHAVAIASARAGFAANYPEAVKAVLTLSAERLQEQLVPARS
jgi:hypothetical protein